MFQHNKICQLFDIQYPLIQAGMIWCSGWKLAAAVSNAGGLGIIGAGSMYPDILKEHIEKAQRATQQPFAVNLPLLYPNIEEHIQTIIDYKVPIVFTSAGSPKKFTPLLQSHGIKVVHVVSSAAFAIKSQQAGVDAVVAEGFEAGGHNGREETTTMCLIPAVAQAINIPLIAAGGIGSGQAMLAAMALGADAVQIGSRFVCSNESSANEAFKQKIMGTKEGDTILTLKEITPVRLIKNEFYQQVKEAYQSKASINELQDLLGKRRAKKGMFEGNITEGELEIGQVAATIQSIQSAADIVQEIITDFKQSINTANQWLRN